MMTSKDLPLEARRKARALSPEERLRQGAAGYSQFEADIQHYFRDEVQHYGGTPEAADRAFRTWRTLPRNIGWTIKSPEFIAFLKSFL